MTFLSSAALVKALLHLGAVLLVGAPVLTLLVAPRLSVGAARRVRIALLLGAVLLAAASLVDVALVLESVLGRLSPELYWRYLRSTR